MHGILYFLGMNRNRLKLPAPIGERLMRIVLLFGVLSVAFFAQGCTCCVYFNHMFNAERAYEEGWEMRTARADSLPPDSVWTTPEERKKWDRTIEKGSRILERFPDEEKHKPMAIFLIGESFRLKGDWRPAVTKYEEFERYFADHDSLPVVQYHKALCLYRDNQYPVARFALEPILNKGPSHPYYNEGLELLAELEMKQDLPDEAIAVLEQLLQTDGVSEYTRAKAHLRLSELYFEAKNYAQSMQHGLDTSLKILPSADQYKAKTYAANSLEKLERAPEAANLLMEMVQDTAYAPWRNTTRIRLGEIYFAMQDDKKGIVTLLEVPQDSSRSVSASHAWYLLGDHAQTVLGNYPRAMANYDSSQSANKYSYWARQARARMASLEEIMAMQNKESEAADGALPPQEEFQMAELFLFRLDEVDSALVRLDRIVQRTPKDSSLSVQAAYARAFIWDEYKQDSARSDSLYRWLIREYPNTVHARKSQEILGIPVNVQTDEDRAYAAFLKAESLYYSINDLPVDSIALIDSVYQKALDLYDSVYFQFPRTDYAPKAIYTKAWIRENHEVSKVEARANYEILAEKYPDTEYGKIARQKLNPTLIHDERQLEILRKAVEKQQREQEEKDKPDSKQPARPIEKDTGEEITDDYEDLYNF